ncbi:NAD(P)-binding protein [Mycobacterium terramassiliense]|uniref:Predicted flavoprotein CzcO associated with the cation diffusion facilitator CzcD n=1 Tax=Mycobacterium terramassiliense TaxID=1841859 RepID=A0A2U3NBI6_9MYCO|nr:NAD(P)-binding protein [Mycobacterium terramassiliense]SPM28784.1 Predicted flavoprotein CzcO associated with the cation diffusion facilitator CzcD [Mycobacterium terramassiliense]
MHTIDADYLVVGAGAMGMAFLDTLLTETRARVVLVDRHHQPGGHWTTAYPFVRLHQPSAFYGVNSLPLGSDAIDQVGWNEGLYELATAGEVCAYYDHVLRRRFLPTGRVSYFPMSEYRGSDGLRGRFTTLGGADYAVDVTRRVVDATYMRVEVPSMRPPPYEVAPGVTCVPPNDLPRLAARERYVIVGAGKTGIDTCLWLLGQGIAADRLTWIMPRDSWLLDRATIQPGSLFADRIKAAFTAQLRAVRDATSVEDLFSRLEDAGTLLRIDPAIRPTMYRCATVTHAELEQLRRITDVVRMGHLLRVDGDGMVLEGGAVRTEVPALYVDCTADGAEKRPATPIFGPGHITLQSVRGCQQIFSAALIAHLETACPDDAAKNALCPPLPHPDSDLDWLRVARADYGNQLRWLDDPDLTAWLATARLDLFGHLMGHLLAPASAKPRVRDRILRIARSALSTTAGKLDQLMAAELSCNPS